MIARRYFISGRVQGVGYRAFSRREMAALGIVGSATNLADGRVEVRVSGTEQQLESLEKSLWRGPPFSQVLSIEPQDGAFT